jgi:hypothetical protein
MSKLVWIALLVLVVVLGRSWFVNPPPTFSLEGSADPGRFQTAVIGSQTRLFAGCYLVDTRTGKTWATKIVNGRALDWKEVEEDKVKPPASSTANGRFQINASYTADTVGQETGTAVRIDTATGDLWLMAVAPPPVRWELLRNQQASEAGAKK